LIPQAIEQGSIGVMGHKMNQQMDQQTVTLQGKRPLISS